MKIIHCADLHLDSKLSANLDKDKAKVRRSELLNTFVRMVRYADNNDISVIIIAGDMFDTKSISANVRNTVLHTINEYPQIRFYYVKGNHDSDNFLSGLEDIPDNLYLFDSKWKTYYEGAGQIAITGLELGPDNEGSAYVSLVLDNNMFNIVILHGQEAESQSKDKAEIINLKELRNKGIDYLALGHIHGYKKAELDARGIYCYPGCLEGRGFDECGEHGFVVLDIDEDKRTYEHKFIPFAYRKLYTVEVDVTGLNSTAEMISKAGTILRDSDITDDSMIKFVLTGQVDVECEKDADIFNSAFASEYYFTKTYDETNLKLDIDSYRLDESLKGELVRQVYADSSISEEDKMAVIRYGLLALAGEEII